MPHRVPPRRTLLRPLAAALALTAMLPIVFSATPAQADTYYPITGSGSTWSQNALDQWRSNVAKNYGMTVNYSGIGSTSGRTDFIAGTVDFAISEIPFQSNPQDGSAPEHPKVGYAYLPIVAGGTSFMYNLKIGGKRVTNLRLSGDVITKIFTGKITNWNDAAIQADNPALAMPNEPITPVIRSDGSGTSAQFTLWMSSQYPKLWTSGMTSQFPSFSGSKAQKGSDGVAGYVSQDYGEGAITYVEYSYAKKAGFPVAKVLNASGYYVEPTAYSVAVALMQAKINTDEGSDNYLTQILTGVYNDDDKRAYPLSSYSYMIVPTEVAGIFNENKGKTLGAFLRYVLCTGQKQADTLGYSPLPMNLVEAGSDQIKRIPGAGSTGIDFGSCDNPTFKAGDSASKNQLASVAPYPADCDKQGTSQCTTGTAGASDTTTPVTGNGTGGTANTTPTTGTSTTPGTSTTGSATPGTSTGGTGTSGGASGTSSDPVYDENGNTISGGSDTSGTGTGTTTGGTTTNTGTAYGAAVSKPFTLPDQTNAGSQWTMVVAALLLVAAVVAPPLVSQRLRRSGRHDGR